MLISGCQAMGRGRTVTSVLVLSLGLAACGSSSSSPARTSTASPAVTPALRVTIGSPTLIFGAMWIALEDGLFAKNHVDVKVVAVGSSAANAMLVGGETDLALTASSVAMALRLQGQPFKIVSMISYYDQRSFALIAAKSVTSIQELAAMGSNCTIATGAPGTGSYGYYATIQKAFGIHCKVSFFSSVPAISADITSGAAQAVVSDPLVAAELAQRGYNEILNPSDMSTSVAMKVAPSRYPLIVAGGLAPVLQAKKVAVERFIEALRQSLALMQGLSPAQLAAITARDTAAFAATPVAVLTSGYELAKPEAPTGASAGAVASSDFANLLNGLITTREAGITLSNPVLSYASSVDMSYFNATQPVTECAAGQQPTTGNICRLS
jgi:ABC-type nitrate/sulfonate/bicarbonate transport system substrate-binding protein